MQSARLANGFSWSFILELEGFHHNGRLSRRTLAMVKRRFPAPVKLVVRTITQPGFRWDEGRLPEGPPQLIFPRDEYRNGQEFMGHHGDRYVIEKIEPLENGTDRATLKRQGYSDVGVEAIKGTSEAAGTLESNVEQGKMGPISDSET